MTEPAIAHETTDDPFKHDQDFSENESVDHPGQSDGRILGSRKRKKKFHPSTHDVSSLLRHIYNPNFASSSGPMLT